MTRPSLPAAPLLMLVTDRTRYGERRMDKLMIAAIAGGVNMVQLREPELVGRDLLGEAEQLRHLAAGGVVLTIYDRADVSIAASADGVHLGAESMPIESVRRAGRNLLIGRTVASLAEAVQAEQAGADYLLVEPVFFGRYGDPRAPLGPTLIRRIKGRVHLPLIAGGGISAGNAHQVIAAGADGVSVVTEIVEAPDPRAAAEDIMASMRNAWPTRPLLRESQPRVSA